MGEKSSVSSSRGGDSMIQNRLEKLQKELNKRLKIVSGTTDDEDEDHEEEHSA